MRRLWMVVSPLAVALAMASPLYVQGAEPVPVSDEVLTELSALDQGVAANERGLPSLLALFARARDNDAELIRQRYEFGAVQEEYPMARSQLLPQVSASGGYLWQDSTNVQTDPEGFGLDQPATRPGQFDEHYWRLQLQQPLFSLERWRKLDVANAQISASALQLAVVEQGLALSVSEAYVKAYLSSQRLGLLESQQAALELQVRQASRAFDLGIGNRVDLLETQSRLDQAIADAVEAENNLDNALSVLERLTGMRPEMRGLAVGDLKQVSIDQDWGDESEWVERIGQNLAVQLASKEQGISIADTSTRRAGHYPEVNLSLSYTDRHSDDELRSSEDYTANVEVSVPLFSGGYTSASVRQGEKRIAANKAAVEHQRNIAIQEVRSSLRALNGSIRRLEALQRAIESSELFLSAAERGEQLGLRDLVDVLDARASLYDQRIKFVDTLGNYALDRLTLYAAAGELDSDDLVEVMQLLISITANISPELLLTAE
ncbi:TolC family outer membrane protein [Vreelandella zhaodongensis]|uniref:TolC family outer membrane protein n=1 Tax=Vreelandella zhaodongensis TaxID=1176240 RepID=UPI003EB9DFB4